MKQKLQMLCERAYSFTERNPLYGSIEAVLTMFILPLIAIIVLLLNCAGVTFLSPFITGYLCYKLCALAFFIGAMLARKGPHDETIVDAALVFLMIETVFLSLFMLPQQRKA